MKKKSNTKTGRSRKDIRGNFDMGTWFGEVKCVHGHPVRLFNLHRCHIVACDTCKTYIHVGENLMSGWRQENSDVWERNWRRISDYQEVVSDAPARRLSRLTGGKPSRLRAARRDRLCQMVSKVLST